MKLQMSIEDALCLQVGLETPAIRATYESLVKNYMQLTGCDKAEAQATIFPDFARAVIRKVKEASVKVEASKTL